MGIKRRKRPEGWPAWFFAGTINEAIFCQEFLADHKLVYTENAFFTPQGKMIDESPLQAEIYEIIEPYGKTMVHVRNDVAALMAEPEPKPVVEGMYDDPERFIWDDLMAKMGNAYAVAGLMGNLYAESALNPHDLQGTSEKKLGMTDESYTAAVNDGSYVNFINDGAGYGIAQWTYYGRKRKLLAYAQERGISIGDLKMQLDFLWQEMGDDFEAVLSALVASQSVREASDIVLTKYGSPPIKAPRFKKNGLLSHSGITTSTPPFRSPSTPSPSKT